MPVDREAPPAHRFQKVDVAARSPWKATATRLIAWLMAGSATLFGVFTAVFGAVAESQQIHGFHNVVVASLLLILSSPPALAIARHPETSHVPLVTLTVLSLAALLTMAASLTIDPFTVPFVALTGVLWTVRPSKQWPPQSDRPSVARLVLVAAGTVPLLVYALDQAELQRTLTGDEHSQLFHWVETSFFATAVLFLGLLSALHPTTYRMAGLIAGFGLTVFGVAALLLSGHASAVAAPWARAATAGGIVFFAMGAWNRSGRPPPAPSERY